MRQKEISKTVIDTKPINKPADFIINAAAGSMADLIGILIRGDRLYTDLIDALSSDIPITDIFILRSHSVKLQEYLIGLRSNFEYATTPKASTSAGLISIPLFDSPPSTARVREELEEVLTGSPELLKRYDAYTFNDPKLWGSFVEAAWYANKFSQSDSFKKDMLSLHLQGIITKEFRHTGHMSNFISTHSTLIRDEALYDEQPKGVTASLNSKVRANKRVYGAMIVSDARLLTQIISEMGHEYRAIQAKKQ